MRSQTWCYSLITAQQEGLTHSRLLLYTSALTAKIQSCLRKKKKKKFFFFFWLRRAACRILVPQPGIEPIPFAVEAQSPNLWTAREFPEKIWSCKKMRVGEKNIFKNRKWQRQMIIMISRKNFKCEFLTVKTEFLKPMTTLKNSGY